MCYCGNLGDSRAVMSLSRGKKCLAITTDHKPSSKSEQDRIINHGGKIY